ncbi:MAG TPA: S41 family peptidase [Deinococcales bacterium]|nr:S41 family peptidase [Deinococcales bacterium]
MNAKLALPALLAILCPAALASPATDLYQEVTQAITRYYQGPAQSVPDLVARHATALTTACQVKGEACDTTLADKEIQALLKDMNDWHLMWNYAGPPTPAAAAQPAAAPVPRLGFQYAFVPGSGEFAVLDVSINGGAYLAGLQRADRIVAVNGKTFTDLKGQQDASAAWAALIQPIPADQKITFTVLRGSAAAPAKLELTLTKNLESNNYLPVLIKPAGAPDGVLALRIPDLNSGQAAQRIHDLVHEAQAQNAKALILEFTQQGTGDFAPINAAIGAFLGDFSYDVTTPASKFVSGFRNGEGFGLTQANATVKIQNPAVWKGKVAIIIDSGTVAGEELVAHYLQKVGGATVIGAPSAGYIQTVPEIPHFKDGSSILIPAYQMHDPDGTLLPERVTPDTVVTVADALQELHNGLDTYYEAAYRALGLK